MNPEYECPVCGDYIAILPTTPENFDCPWCKEPLFISSDAEFEDGIWHDLTRLVSHKQTMIDYAKEQNSNKT